MRYIEQVAAVRVVIPPDKLLPPETYTVLPRNNRIDELAYARFEELGLFPSDPSRDDEYLRRATLDVLGRLPSIRETRAFLADTSPDKRAKLADRLLSPTHRFDYADFWATKWGDLLRPNTQRVGVKPVYLLDQWIREKFRDNTTWDVFVTELLTAPLNALDTLWSSGSSRTLRTLCTSISRWSNNASRIKPGILFNVPGIKIVSN